MVLILTFNLLFKSLFQLSTVSQVSEVYVSYGFSIIFVFIDLGQI